jgi:hypothetical protein
VATPLRAASSLTDQLNAPREARIWSAVISLFPCIMIKFLS